MTVRGTGLLSVGLFKNATGANEELGLFHGGSGRLMGVQLLGVVAIVAWSTTTSYLLFGAIRRVMGLRMSEDDEKRGADEVEHMDTITRSSSVFGRARRNRIAAVFAALTRAGFEPRIALKEADVELARMGRSG